MLCVIQHKGGWNSKSKFKAILGYIKEPYPHFLKKKRLAMVQAYTASALKRQLKVSQVYTVSRFRLNGELLFQKQNTKKNFKWNKKEEEKNNKTFFGDICFLKV